MKKTKLKIPKRDLNSTHIEVDGYLFTLPAWPEFRQKARLRPRAQERVLR